MTILIIGYTHDKYDKRVFRTVQALSKVGKVIYQYLTYADEPPYEEGNVRYFPTKCVDNREGSPLKKLFDRRPLDKKIYRLIATEEYDVLYMHHFLATIPLKPFEIAKRRGKKIVYDIHEYHPENFLESLTGLSGYLKVKTMQRIFSKQLELSDLSIFVSEELRDDALQNVNINKERTYIIPNYALKKVNFDKNKKKKEIVYVGKITRRAEDEKKLIASLVDCGFSFRIIGMDVEIFSDIPHVYTPFLQYEEMMEEISKASFSLISYNCENAQYTKNYDFALPNKFFDSIVAGTPVIVKDSFVSMAKQVRDLGLGVIINPLNVEESKKRILDAYNNYENILKNIEKNQDKFVWNQDKEQKFIKRIEEAIKS